MHRGRRAGAGQKPLAEVRSPLRARAYRAKFRPFKATRYLDVRALRRAARATIECGTFEFGQKSVTVAADLRRGKIVSLRPLGCDCTANGGGKLRSATMKEAVRALGQVLERKGISTAVRPSALRISRRFGFHIPIGPIIIVIGEPWIDVCIEITVGNKTCWYCLFAPDVCIGFGPPF